MEKGVGVKNLLLALSLCACGHAELKAKVGQAIDAEISAMKAFELYSGKHQSAIVEECIAARDIDCKALGEWQTIRDKVAAALVNAGYAMAAVAAIVGVK